MVLKLSNISQETHKEHTFTVSRYHFYAVTFLTITTFCDGAAKFRGKEPLTQVPPVPDTCEQKTFQQDLFTIDLCCHLYAATPPAACKPGQGALTSLLTWCVFRG